ncbi:MAG: TetR/AcrR family transcriptional regulator [Bacteroidota bacterium]
MKRSTRNAAKAKKEIIEKSAAVFNVHGYAGTKMQMLVDATGYQMGGIYRHFETKMDLAKASFRHNYEVLIKRNFELAEELDPKEKLFTIFKNYQKSALDPQIPGGCPLLNTAIEMDDTDEEFRALAHLFIKEVLSTIEQILEEGKSAGFFDPMVNAKQEAQYLFASIEGAIMLSRVTKDIKPFLAIFNRAITHVEEKIIKNTR